MAWDLAVGDAATRTELHVRHGGRPMCGISAPRVAPGGRDIMLWWQPDHGAVFGYDDGWTSDGAFYFSGTGQLGDQQFGGRTPENGRVRDHIANGDRIRLLRYTDPNYVRYICELRVDEADPWQWRDAPDKAGHLRRVIQFRFLPIGPVSEEDAVVPRREAAVPAATPSPLAALPPEPEITLIEALQHRSFQRLVKAQTQTAQRLEAILVHDFSRWLTSRGVSNDGMTIPYLPEHRNLRADLFVTAHGVLVEAKASTAREHIRMAIGQLLDYGRFVDPRPGLAVLTPSRPPDDMVSLLRTLSIDALWSDGIRGFDGTAPWLPRSEV